MVLGILGIQEINLPSDATRAGRSAEIRDQSPPWDLISSLTFGLKLEITSPVPLSDVIRNKNMQWKPLADVTLSLSPKFSFLHGWQALE